jgi:ABC-2 type transport system ATP-binding protein
VLGAVGYVAQGAPLYRSLTVGETLEFARKLNPRWSGGVAGEFLGRMSSRARVSTLPEGDRARLALALALGKRPSLLLLDEPFARLDPLAGREFLQLLMDGVAETGATVVIASHVVADIERVCDYIVLLSDGRVSLEGNVENLLESHCLLSGARRPLGTIRNVTEIVRERHSGRQLTLLVRNSAPIVDPSWVVDRVGLEELLLAYMAPGRLSTPPAPPPERVPLQWHG